MESLSPEDQETIINQIGEAANYCSTKGLWSQAVAIQAKNGISSVKEQITKVYEKAKGQKIPLYKLIERERIIRTAYTRGYKDPFDFGREIVGFCMIEGY